MKSSSVFEQIFAWLIGGGYINSPLASTSHQMQNGQVASKTERNMNPCTLSEQHQTKKATRWLHKNTCIRGPASLFSDWNQEMVGALLPIILFSIFGAPAFILTMVAGVADGVSSLFEELTGWYSDRIGKRKGWAVIGYFLSAAGRNIAALATRGWVAVTRKVGCWCGGVCYPPNRDRHLAKSTRPVTDARAVGLHRLIDRLGAITAPLTAILSMTHLQIRTIFLIALIPGLCALLSIVLFVRGKTTSSDPSQKEEGSPHFMKCLVPIGLLGISNFAPMLLILRAQELLSTCYDTMMAGTIAVGLYALSHVIYTIVGYPIGVLADRCNKKVLLSIGYLFCGLLCFGFLITDTRWWFLSSLFAVSGIYTAILESSQPA